MDKNAFKCVAHTLRKEAKANNNRFLEDAVGVLEANTLSTDLLQSILVMLIVLSHFLSLHL